MKLSNFYPIKDNSFVYNTCPEFPTKDKVGIEVELEGLPYSKSIAIGDYWELSKDPSLRDYGVEFRTRDGLWGEDLLLALKDLDKYIENYEKKFNKISVSERCSVHIHLGMENCETWTLYNMTVLFIIFEKMLFNFGGKDRRDLAYCIPLTELNSLHSILDAMKQGRNGEDYPANACHTSKYSFFNTLSLTNHGTIEVRNLSGTKDPLIIFKWIKILLAIKAYAIYLGKDFNMELLPSRVSQEGLVPFVDKIFGTFAEDLMYPGWSKDLLTCIRELQPFLLNKVEILHNFERVKTRPLGLFRYKKLHQKVEPVFQVQNLFDVNPVQYEEPLNEVFVHAHPVPQGQENFINIDELLNHEGDEDDDEPEYDPDDHG